MIPTPTPTAGLVEGEWHREEALARLQLHRACLVRRVQRALLSYLLARGPSTSDPVRDLVAIPVGIDPRLVGAAVRTLAELRLIRRAGLARSTRPEAHGRDLPLWEIACRDAAVAWQSAHPELPTPAQTEGEGQQLTLWD